MRKLLVVILALLAAQLGQAQNCKTSQYKGVYSALALGEFISTPLPPELLGPTTRIGLVEGDGKGNAKIRAITSLNGFILEEEYIGSYFVNPDCTTEVILFIPFPGVPDPIPFQFKGILSDNFQQHDIMLVNPPGSTVVITLRAQNKGNCSASDLKDGYEVNMRGLIGLPGPGTPFARLGRVVFDGAGTFVLQSNTSTGGAISPDNFGGTYAVNSSCEFTMTHGGEVWSGVLMDNSSGAHLMATAPMGTTVAGTLKEQ
jgi:hypothetical protein